MHKVQQNAKIPIPTILDWSDDLNNPIGSAYIIIEHAGGVSLHEIWPNMSFTQRMNCIGSISTNIMKMSELDFPVYGSLYFTYRCSIARCQEKRERKRRKKKEIYTEDMCKMKQKYKSQIFLLNLSFLSQHTSVVID